MPRKKKKLIEDYRLRYQERQVARRYHEGYSKRLSLKNYRMKLVAERERSIVRSILEDQLDDVKSLLDIPCGGGKISAIIQGEGDGFAVFGADVSSVMLRIARESFLSMSGFCGLTQADATEIPFRSGSFDCVVCLRLMHRLPTEIRQKILFELARVTKRYVVISYGVSGVIDRLRRFCMKRNPKAPYYMATEKGALQEIGWGGLRICSSWGVIPYLYYERIFVLEKL